MTVRILICVFPKFLMLKRNIYLKFAKLQVPTRLRMNVLYKYLEQEKYKKLPEITDEELPGVLEGFFVALHSSKKEKYKSSSLKCARAALNRHFKDTRAIDIISDSRFIRVNELFTGILKQNKAEGRGNVVHKEPISDEDLERIHKYFETNVTENPTPRNLQEIILFNVRS